MSKVDVLGLLAAIWLAPRVTPWVGTLIGISYVVLQTYFLYWK